MNGKIKRNGNYEADGRGVNTYVLITDKFVQVTELCLRELQL